MFIKDIVVDEAGSWWWWTDESMGPWFFHHQSCAVCVVCILGVVSTSVKGKRVTDPWKDQTNPVIKEIFAVYDERGWSSSNLLLSCTPPPSLADLISPVCFCLFFAFIWLFFGPWLLQLVQMFPLDWFLFLFRLLLLERYFIFNTSCHIYISAPVVCVFELSGRRNFPPGCTSPGLTTSAFFEWVWESLWTKRLASMRETRTESETEKTYFPEKRKKKGVGALVRRHRVYLVVGKRNTTRVLRWLCARMTEPSASLLQLSVRLVFWVGHESPTLSLYPPPIAPKDGRWLSEQPEFSVVLPSSFKKDLYLAFTRPTSIYTFTFCRPPPSLFRLPLIVVLSIRSVYTGRLILFEAEETWYIYDSTPPPLYVMCVDLWYSVTALFTFPTPAPLIYTLGLSLSLSMLRLGYNTLLHQTHFLGL